MNMNNILKKKNDLSLFEQSSSFKDFFQMPFFKQDNVLKTDIIENKDSYTLILDIPGCNKNDVTISYEDGYLTVEVNQTSNHEISDQTYLKRERMYGSYSRSYYIGNNVNSKDINATFNNGTLHINFPRDKQNTSTTYIPIK